jgi:hypothetical protein
LPAGGDREQLLVVISRDISQRKELEERQAWLYDQQSRQAKAMAEIVHSADFQRSDVEHGSGMVLGVLCQTLKAQSAELWKLESESEGRFVCLRSLRTDENLRQDLSLESLALPSLLREYRVIALPDDAAAVEDLDIGKALFPGAGMRTIPDEVTARLIEASARGMVAAVWLEGKPAGFLLVTISDPNRVWSIYEQNFCVALADLVAMLLEGRQRLDTLHALELSQKLIILVMSKF